MARVKIHLDTRKSSKKKDGSFPLGISLYHKKPRFISCGYSTSTDGWDDKNLKFRKSVSINKYLNCDEIEQELAEKLHAAKQVVKELGKSLNLIDVTKLILLFKDRWDKKEKSELRNKIENNISLAYWGEVLCKRKIEANKPGTAKWYSEGVRAIKKFNGGSDILLYDINVTFLKNFEAHHIGKNNSKNTIGIYLRAVMSIYNSAIKEDQFKPSKNAFEHYRIPTGGRTKKRVVVKNKIMGIKSLDYKKDSSLWHAKNYAMIMFYCRGMNFIDLVKIKVKDIVNDRLYYGRSKTDDPFSVKITKDLQSILDYYLVDKKPDDFLFPTNYDGSSKHYQKYKSQRRRMNERLKIIAKDVGIEGNFTTYYIRHSWATIAKYMGISTAIISEGLGHSSIRTTEIYLKDFDDDTLDAANALIVA